MRPVKKNESIYEPARMTVKADRMRLPFVEQKPLNQLDNQTPISFD